MYILIIVQSLEPNLKGEAINTCPGEIVQQRLFPFHLLKKHKFRSRIYMYM